MGVKIRFSITRAAGFALSCCHEEEGEGLIDSSERPELRRSEMDERRKSDNCAQESTRAENKITKWSRGSDRKMVPHFPVGRISGPCGENGGVKKSDRHLKGNVVEPPKRLLLPFSLFPSEGKFAPLLCARILSTRCVNRASWQL